MAGAAEDGTAEADPPARGRRWIGHALRTAFALAMLPVAFAVVAALGLVGQEIGAPTWLKSRIEAQAAAALDGGSLRFGDITVRLPADLHPRVRLTDTVLRGADGEVLARVPLIEATLSPRGLILRQEVLPQEIVLTGTEIALRRDADGTVAFALGGAGMELAAPGLGGVLDLVDSLFERPGLSALNGVRMDGLVVNYTDARAGRAWTVDGGQIALGRAGGETRLQADLALLSGRSFVTALTLRYSSPRGSRAATVQLDVTEATAADIASQAPALRWLSVLDAPLSASIRTSLDDSGALAAFAADLDIGAGALAPVGGAVPVAFSGAAVRLTYDPAAARIGFDSVTVQSDWGEVAATGHAILTDLSAGLPGAVVAQFDVSRLRLNPPGVLAAPVDLPAARADLRLALQPFALTIGQAAVWTEATGEGSPVTLRGEIGAAPEGWSVALDLSAPAIDINRALALWPVGVAARARDWVARNVPAARITDLALGLRLAPGVAPRVALTHRFDGATVQALRDQPPITDAAGYVAFDAGGLTVALEAGQVAPARGGAVAMAGSVLTIPPGPEPRATLALQAAGDLDGLFAILDGPPFGYIGRAGLPADPGRGAARIAGEVRFPLAGPPAPGQVAFDIDATVTGLVSETLVPDRTLSAESLRLRAVPGEVTVAGAARLDGLPLSATLTAALGEGAAPPRIAGTVEISPRLFDTFGIALPEGMVAGEGTGSFTLRLPRGAGAEYVLTSDLRGLRLALPALGWTKGAGSAGEIVVEGRAGEDPAVTRIALSAAGLDLSGRIDLAPGGGMAGAVFDRLRLNGWLDVPVRLTPQGQGRAPAVTIGGGRIDLRAATFGAGEGAGEGGPLDLTLDRLVLTEGITLTDLAGEFTTAGGLSGEFRAAVNGAASVAGTVVPLDGRTAVRIRSERAGEVLAAAGFLRNALGGTMDLTLLPAGGAGTFDGTLFIGNLRVQEAPALASLLNAISVVGLIQQMAGQGLVFDEVMADFRITPDRITVTRSSAVGAGLGLSLDGIYTMADGVMDFQGVVSPFYLINAVGAVLTRRGEGLIGFNFTLRGPVDAAQVVVNPLSVLTPGMFREIFRRPAPTVTE